MTTTIEYGITEIYSEYTPGSTGFCIAVETHCAFDISRDEIGRISRRAGTPAEFVKIWENEDWWTDANDA